MAISDEITRLQSAKSDLKSSINAKTDAQHQITNETLDDYADFVDSIQTGGGDSKEDEIISKRISGAYTNDRVTNIGRYAFASCPSLTAVSFAACTNISNSAFASCSSLTTASFPLCLTIDSFAFLHNSSLTNISFPKCTLISTSAFAGCVLLPNVSFPVCTSVNGYAFQSCSSLTTASFPMCTNISSNAFARCQKLLSLYLLGSSVPTLSNINAFNLTPISSYTTATGGVYGSIIVKPSLIDAFKSATNWSAYSSRFSAWNGVD